MLGHIPISANAISTSSDPRFIFFIGNVSSALSVSTSLSLTRDLAANRSTTTVATGTITRIIGSSGSASTSISGALIARKIAGASANPIVNVSTSGDATATFVMAANVNTQATVSAELTVLGDIWTDQSPSNTNYTEQATTTTEYLVQ